VVASHSTVVVTKGKTMQCAWIRCPRLSRKEIPTTNFPSSSKRAQSMLHLIQSNCGLDQAGVADRASSLRR